MLKGCKPPSARWRKFHNQTTYLPGKDEMCEKREKHSGFMRHPAARFDVLRNSNLLTARCMLLGFCLGRMFTYSPRMMFDSPQRCRERREEGCIRLGSWPLCISAVNSSILCKAAPSKGQVSHALMLCLHLDQVALGGLHPF